MIIIGVTAIIIVLIISISVAVITHNSTGNNTTNNTTVNTTVNNTTVNATNNTTSNSTNTSNAKSSSAKSSSNSKASKGSGDSGYYYSPQYDGYIKVWYDSDGNYHVRGRDNGLREDYNPHTGDFVSYSDDYGYEYDYRP